MIEPQLISATEVRQESHTIATTIATVDLKLQGLLTELTKANGYDPNATISVLERMGLSTATTFVKPLLAILKRPTDSPLRQLTTFQMQAIYSANERIQGIILDELEEDLRSGRRTIDEVRSGIVRILQLQYKAKVDAARQREDRPSARTRDDYAAEVMQLRDKVALLETALEKVADEAGMDVNVLVASLTA